MYLCRLITSPRCSRTSLESRHRPCTAHRLVHHPFYLTEYPLAVHSATLALTCTSSSPCLLSSGYLWHPGQPSIGSSASPISVSKESYSVRVALHCFPSLVNNYISSAKPDAPIDYIDNQLRDRDGVCFRSLDHDVYSNISIVSSIWKFCDSRCVTVNYPA